MTTRQRPETANGVIFTSREGEEGEMQLIIYRTNSDKRHFRPVVLGARLIVVKGRWQLQGEVCNIIAGHPEACPRSWRAGDEETGFQVAPPCSVHLGLH